MGMGRSELEFKGKLPSVFKIKEKFQEKTGLYLQVIFEINLTEISSDSIKVIDSLNSSRMKIELYQKEIERLEKEYENGNYLEEMSIKMSDKNDNYIKRSYFVHSDFYEIEFRTIGNCIELDWYAKQNYFIKSILGTLKELGGESKFKSENSTKRPKKMLKWKEYSWYNRPRK